MRFFFNDTATTEIYTLSLHDALPIFPVGVPFAFLREEIPVPALPWREFGQRAAGAFHAAEREQGLQNEGGVAGPEALVRERDRKSTRLNSSHAQYPVCRLLLENKKKP